MERAANDRRRTGGRFSATAGPFLAYLRPYWRPFLAGCLCLLLSSLAGLAFPFLMGLLIDSATHGLGPARAIIKHPLDFNVIALALVVTLGIQAICSFGETFWLASVGEHVLGDLRNRVYGHVVRLPMEFFAARRVGELTSRIADSLSQIQATLTGSLPQFFGQLITLVGAATLMIVVSPRLTFAVLALIPVIIAIAIVFGRATRRASKEVQDKLADANVVVEETFQGIATVKAFAQEGYEEQRYAGNIRSVIAAAMHRAKLRGALGSLMIFSVFGAIMVTVWYGSRLVETDKLTIGGMAQFALYAMYVAIGFGQFARLYADVQRMLGATDVVRTLMDEIPEPRELFAPTTGLQRLDIAAPQPPRIAGEIALEDVCFSYPSRREIIVLRGVSLVAGVGQRIALVGPSGAGKSTIVSLLLRFYEPDSGQIRIGGTNIRDWPLYDLRSQIAVVPQDALLFGGTIGENIAYGRDGALQAEIEEAARKANAVEFIDRLPEGYRTIVGERGVKLSGGQRQRIAIARAVLRNPAILILDEATSSVDSQSEMLIEQALDHLMRGRTSIIIAHRFSTVRRADRIYVLQNGQIVEDGTYASLLARPDGVFRTLSEIHFAGRAGGVDDRPAPSEETLAPIATPDSTRAKE